MIHLAWWMIMARTKRTAQEPGRSCSFLWKGRPTGSRARAKSPTGLQMRMTAITGEESTSAHEVGRRQGEPEPRPKVYRKSEGCIGAMTSGNGWHPEPAEQRRPVLVRT